MMHMANANGIALPPMYVFSGVKLIHNNLEGAPKGKHSMQIQNAKTHALLVMFHVMLHHSDSAMSFQKNGSFTSDTFCDVIRHLVRHTPPGQKLLIIHGHNSHHEVDGLDL